MKHYNTTAGSFAAIATILSIGAVYAGIDDPLYKLLPNDGAAGDIFGISVAISGTRAIVGARLDGDNGVNSGSAYLFDTTTGQQLFKLLPNDGEAFNYFGWSVAIDGTRAIVGARGDNDNGASSGSAYLFDTTTGLQIGAKLLANDGAEADFFGHAVAISGTRAIVGAWGSGSGSAYLFDTTTGLQIGAKLLPDVGGAKLFGFSVAISGTRAIVGARLASPNGSGSGSAFLFDTTTGLQLFELLPNDGAMFDGFGWSVAIDSTRAIVGAIGDDDNGSFSGSAYLFDITTGLQIGAKLLPNDGAEGDQFGYSVAISSPKAIVGALDDDDNGADSGSAYIFDVTTGLQTAKILPDDGAAGDRFGVSVAISDVRAIFGAHLVDDKGSNSGAAYITAVDTDRDGLLDYWETNGIPYIDGGGVEQHYLLPGADPNHKDFFVEVDSMVGFGFNATAQANVIQAFANAPNALVNNPDGLDGITLHLTVTETNLPVTPFPNDWVEFDPLKKTHFGKLLGERDGPDWLGPAPDFKSLPKRDAKLKAYRYCIFGQSHGPGTSSGKAEPSGNDFMVTLGLWGTPGGTVNQQAGTFMHEFGHTLSLRHGGGDNIHRKPNYYSVMNYVWQNPIAAYAAFWRLDYSHVKLDPLDESALIESDGIDGSDPAFAAVQTLVGIGGEPPVTLWTKPDGTPTDWNLNGTIDAGFVALDMNYHFQCFPPGGGPPVPCPTPDQVLEGYDDWSNLRYSMFGPFFAQGVHDVTTLDTEMTLEIFEQMDAITPPVVCAGDTNGDSMVNVTDLLTLLGGWGPNPGHAADFNDDGSVNVTDLLTLLAAWGACP